VFVLANDAVADWFSAFVASFRTHNPQLPLRLIPFDEKTRRCEELIRRAGGEVYRDDAAFTALERIGRALELGTTPSGPHWFRRFAAFGGPFETFAYLDCRMLVLADIAGFADAAATFDVPLVHYDQMIDQVYDDGPVRREFCRQGLGHGFSSNIWASRRGLFTIAEMECAAQECVGVRSQMNPRNTDQFFLNYLCDSRGIRACHIADLDARYAHSAWANDRGTPYRDADGVWRKWDFGGLQHRKEVLFLHWAGIRLHPAMPHFRLHRRFREPRASWPTNVMEACQMAAGGIFRSLRGNRLVNAAYHAWRG